MKKAGTYFLAGAVLGAAAFAAYWLMRGAPPAPPSAGAPAVTMAAAATTPASATAARAVDPQDLVGSVVAGLRSSNVGERQRAMEALAALPNAARSWLHFRAEETADPDLRALLEKRIGEMDEELAVDPPPLSLHVKDALIAEVVTQLRDQTHARLRIGTLPTIAHYSLDADALPFWDIFARLAQQHPISIATRMGPAIAEMMFIDSAPINAPPQPEVQKVLVQGSFMCSARWLPPVPARGGVVPARDQRNRLSVTFAVDPRLTVLEMQAKWNSIRDERDHALYTPPAQPAPVGIRRFNAETHIDETLQLTTPDDAGARIGSWKVQVHVVLAVSSREFELPDIQNTPPEPHRAGTTTATITGTGAQAQPAIEISSISDVPGATPYFVFDLFDRIDQILLHGSWAGKSSFRPQAGAGAPYRVHLAIPLKIKEYNLEFDFKDWPLPKNSARACPPAGTECKAC